MESPRPLRNPYREAEFYLEQAEEEISRSLHELADIGKSKPTGLYKKNPRRKRFTKKYRRSNTVEVCLMNGNKHSDSSDSECTARRRSLGRLTEGNHIEENERPKPPPRTKKSRVNVIESNNVHDRRKSSSKFDDIRQKSQSVRELTINGDNEWPRIDFKNPESVTRWASQILEELESLPGSNWDIQDEEEMEQVSIGRTSHCSDPTGAMNEQHCEQIVHARLSLEQACDELLDVGLSDPQQLISSQIDLLANRIPDRMIQSLSEQSATRVVSLVKDSDTDDQTPTQSPIRKLRPKRPKPSPRKRRSTDIGTEITVSLGADTFPAKVHRKESPLLKSNNTQIKAVSLEQGHTQRRSVQGVVASIIRQAEAQATTKRSTSTSTDEESLLESDPNDPYDISYDLRDACTQTTPFSLSRSSSFTWMSELEEEELEHFRSRPDPDEASSSPTDSDRTPSPPPLPPTRRRRSSGGSLHLSDVSGCDSSDTEQCPVPPPRRIGQSIKAHPQPSNTEELDESIQLLLQYSENADEQPAMATGWRKQKFDTAAIQLDNVLLNTFEQLPNERVGARIQTEAINTGRQKFMAESVYDNVPALRRQWLASHGMLRPTVDAWNSAQITNGQSNEMLSNVDGSDSLVNTPCEMMPRDLSVNSGILADSESSPISPEMSTDFLSLTQSTSAEVHTLTMDPATPDSLKSLTTSSEEGSLVLGSVGGLNTEPMSVALRQPLEGSSPEIQRNNRVYSRPPVPAKNRSKDVFGKEVTSSMPFLDRAGSYDALDINTDRLGSGSNLASQTSDSGFSSSKERAEAEAANCCKWLKAAGFPQYAQMYEDHQFPIDVHSVQTDHEFLDQDSLQALFRRLHTLNRCTLMKIDNVVLRRDLMEENSDEEEETSMALSKRWRYQRKSKTWSRIAEEFSKDYIPDRMSTDGSSPLSPQLTTLNETSAQPSPLQTADTNSLDGSFNKSYKCETELLHVMVAERTKTEEGIRTDEHERTGRGAKKLQRSQSERIKDRAKAFMRRMDIRSSSRRRKPIQRLFDRNEIVIGNPVLVSHHSASPPQMRMFKSQIVNDPVSQQLEQPKDVLPAGRSKRYGRVFESPTSPETHFFHKQTYVDKNSNIDRVFIPKQSIQTTSSLSNNSAQKHLLNRPAGSTVAPAPSPVFADRTSVQDNHNMPLIVFNRSFSTSPHPLAKGSYGSLNRSRELLEERLNGFRNAPDSSPEITNKANGQRLRVQVDIEPTPQTHKHRVIGSSQQSHSSLDSSDTDSPRYFEPPERRDSGVGSSLSRSPSGPTKAVHRSSRPRIASKHDCLVRGRPSSFESGQANHMDALTVPQLSTLRQLALLKLTALMERYSPNSRTSGGGPAWNWGVQKLIRKIKNPEHKTQQKERQVFGVTLCTIAQRTGLPLPPCILHAMRFLRQQAPDSVGIFRKSGVRSRIQKLKNDCDTTLEMIDFNSQQVYDVADMLKQYFRELPEPLMTNKLSETFIAIFLYVPTEMRFEALQKAILLLPDENRETLQTLLYFLRDVSLYSDTNQMSAQNLSVCFAPSLFQLSSKLSAISPTRRHKTITGGLPNEKELKENQACQACLTQMIEDCKQLFYVPCSIQERYCFTENEEVHLPLVQLGGRNGNYKIYLEECLSIVLREHRDRWKGWVTEGNFDGVEITCKKTNDNYPLKYWRCWTDVEAPPKELLTRILRERDLWDDQILKWNVVGRLSDNCEVFQYILNDMPPHPTRDFSVVRLWKSDVPELRGGCALVEVSVNVPEAPLMGGIRAHCLASRFLIEPCGAGRSRVTLVARMDVKGRGKAWYSKVLGYQFARQITRLRDSFRQTAEGPETKV